MPSIWSAIGFADCRKEPDKWNQQWEDHLTIFGSVSLIQGLSESMEEEALTDHRHRLRALCKFQNELTVMAAQCFGQYDFGSNWLKLSVSDREKHLLEGMVRTCTMMRGMEDYRMYCPEVSLPYLEKNGGRGYLRLLKYFMVKDPTLVATMPIYLPSAQWDRYVMGKQESALSGKELVFKAYYDGVRNTFICKQQYQSILTTSFKTLTN